MKAWRKRILTWLGVRLLKMLIELIGWTCRVSVQIHPEVLQDLKDRRRPVIFSFWHNRIFYCAYYLWRHAFRKGIHLTVLISQSGDGELIARVVAAWGGSLARGSSSRGGREALSLLTKAIRKQGSSIVTTPDGPRGPVYVLQPGSVMLAQVTGTEIVPVCFAAERFWRLRSWDGFLIPKPFSKVVISFLPPVTVPRALDDAGRESFCRELEAAMMAQVRACDAVFVADAPE